jgi:hypothetical protein
LEQVPLELGNGNWKEEKKYLEGERNGIDPSKGRLFQWMVSIGPSGRFWPEHRLPVRNGFKQAMSGFRF